MPAGEGVTTVVVELRDDLYPDLVGVGEGYPDRFYGETPGRWPPSSTSSSLGSNPTPSTTGGVGRRGAGAHLAVLDRAIRGHGSAKCAIDIALHDLVGKAVGQPVHALIGLSPDIPPTDFTIGIDAPEIVAERAARAADFPALKIKLGGPQDLATLRAVRAVFDGPIRVDANTGWTRDDAERLLPEIIALGVELIEQPFPARAYRDLGWLQERSSIPIVADESAVMIEDLDALVGVVAGVNVKLAKCGGIAPRRRCSNAPASSASGPFSAAWRRPRSGSPAPPPSPRSQTGSISTAACSLAMTRSRGWSSTPDHRWTLTDRPGLGVTRRG